ncbi:MAG TPA: radical SAM protein [Anaerolineae bacterium]|nr:radical SAM protein [Anaerolineae bacterium]
MRISLIGPKWNQMVNNYPPLGLAYLAAVAEQEGHDVRVHDFGLRPDRPLEAELADVLAFRPDLVGFTSMTTSQHSVEQAAAPLKEELGVPLVIGGPHATVMPERTLSDPNFDFLVYAEGEETWRELLAALAAGDQRYDGIAGLWWKQNGRIMRNADRPLIPDLDALPFPARHLLELDRYPLYAPGGERMLTVLSSRGCPYNCSFCFKGIVGRTYRQRSPGNIVAELRQIVERYSVRHVYFMDDLFTIDARRLNALLDAFLAADLDIRWQCLARVDRVGPEILEKMHRAGCREIHYGIESGNLEILAATAKHIRLDQVEQAVKWTEEAGIAAKGYFMLGLPGDNEETMRQTIEFAAGLPLTEAMFSIATPFPGTQLWDELLRQRPGTEYNTDFTQAYYYNSYQAEIAPFLNVSEVSDERLSQLVLQARQRFLDMKARRVYHSAFGQGPGALLWRVSRWTPLRLLGRALTRLGLFGRFRQLKNTGESAKWG